MMHRGQKQALVSCQKKSLSPRRKRELYSCSRASFSQKRTGSYARSLISYLQRRYPSSISNLNGCLVLSGWRTLSIPLSSAPPPTLQGRGRESIGSLIACPGANCQGDRWRPYKGKFSLFCHQSADWWDGRIFSKGLNPSRSVCSSCCCSAVANYQLAACPLPRHRRGQTVNHWTSLRLGRGLRSSPLVNTVWRTCLWSFPSSSSWAIFLSVKISEEFLQVEMSSCVWPEPAHVTCGMHAVGWPSPEIINSISTTSDTST